MDKHDTIDAPDIEEEIARLSRMMRRQKGGGALHLGGGKRLLEIVIAEDGIRASSLAQRLNIRPSSLTDALNRMEVHGLIERRHDEEDSRVTCVHATEKGVRKFEDHKNEHDAWSAALSGCITREEKEQFFAISEKIIKFFENQPQDDRPHGDRHRQCKEHE